MKRKILFIGPKIANIYLDVIAEMNRQGYEVDFYEYKSYKDDPHNLKGHRKYGKLFVPEKKFERKIKQIWTDLLNTEPYKKTYDLLFVIDGDSLHPCLFEILKKRNPNLKSVNYLFDSTRGNYEFNVHFKYFDKVATFDIADSKRYGIDLLPIYWSVEKDCEKQDLVMFGLGAYIPNRYELFKILDEFSKENGLPSFIKIFNRVIENERKHQWKSWLIEKIGLKSYMIPLKLYHTNLITHESMPTAEYRRMIMRSKVIVDSNAPAQDGLTARFMWALGAERKIITTNSAVKEYDFYTDKQIFVVEDISSLVKNSAFVDFLNSEYHMPTDVRDKINHYRIDNWLKYLLS